MQGPDNENSKLASTGFMFIFNSKYKALLTWTIFNSPFQVVLVLIAGSTGLNRGA